VNAEDLTAMQKGSYLLPDPGGAVVRGLLDELFRLQQERDELIRAIKLCHEDGGCRAYLVAKELMG
jgi:hypothetical protein